MKATAKAPSNIAFIKYWGKKDEILKLPENGSFSMNLDNLWTKTTVEFNPKYAKDFVTINADAGGESRVVKHLERIRKLAGINHKAKVASFNNFPIGTGLSSSASGFAALTVAAVGAAGLKLSQKELSILSRQGSGSSCRSIPDGFVQWLDGNTSESSYAVSLYPADYWDIVDVVTIVSEKKKEVTSTEGQKLAVSSPFFPVRLKRIKNKIKLAKSYLKAKDFTGLGQLAEAEALEMHAVMLTSTPSLIYWTPGTLMIMKLVKRWRQEGTEVYFTINTGQDIHLICQEKTKTSVINKLRKIDIVKKIIINKPADGARLIQKHLF